MNVMENDYVTFYGQYKGVTSQTTQWNPGLMLIGVFSETSLYYNQAMPYVKAKYVDILAW